MIHKFGIQFPNVYLRTFLNFLFYSLIAVCTYRLMMISIERSKTAEKSTLEIRDKFSLRQNAVQDKIQFENFFPMVGNNLFWTEFCLRLNLSQTEFVSDYIPQLCMQSFNL